MRIGYTGSPMIGGSVSFLNTQQRLNGLSPDSDARRLTLLPDQLAARNRLVDLWRGGASSVMICAPTGSGKCHPAGERVVMFDGSLKRVEDIRVGDRLMGPDSQPRRVMGIGQGYGDIYRVTPVKGEPFRVNGEHLLSLVRTGEGNRKPRNRSGGRRDRNGEIVTVSVSDWLRWSANQRHIHKLYRSGVIEWPKSNQLVDPYFVGLLLGDGTLQRGRVAVTTVDKEIADEVYAQAEQRGLQVRCDQHGERPPTYYIHGGRTGGKQSHMLEDIRAIGIAEQSSGNKAIPRRYRVASADQRRQLLAGLLDSDGHLSGSNGFEFVSKSVALADGVAFVARSLGIRVAVSEKVIDGTTYQRVHLSGDVAQIPTRLERKQAFGHGQKRNPLRTGFDIQPDGREPFYGFQLDGDQLYLMSDFTVTHNTVLATELMRSSVEAGSKSLFIADLTKLVDQARRTFTRYGLPVGVTQADQYGNDAPVVVASAQTLQRPYRRPVDIPKLIVFDEAHVQYQKVLEWAKGTGSKIVGLSATPLSAGLDRWYSDVINVVTTNELIERGRLVPMRAYLSSTQLDHDGVKRNRLGAYDKGELSNRAATITGDVVSEWVQRKTETFGSRVRVPTVVFTNTVADGEAYCAEFARAGYDFRQTTYRSSDRAKRDEILRLFEDQEIDGVVSCHALAKGWDSSIVLCVIDLQTNGSSVMPTIQKYGRGMRIHADIDADGGITHKPINADIPRKEQFILLDHVGNTTGWAEEIDQLYRYGVGDLVSAKKDYATQRRTKDEADPTIACGGCGYVMERTAAACPMCGRERQRRAPERPLSGPGQLVHGDIAEIAAARRMAKRSAVAEAYEPLALWQMVCAFTERRYSEGNRPRWAETAKGRRWYAAKQYESLAGQQASPSWGYAPRTLPCLPDVDAAIRAQLKAYWVRSGRRS